MKTLRRVLRWLPRAVTLAALVSLALPAFALAAAHGVGFAPSVQTWALILGAITPLFTYVLNHFAPWVSEAVKAVVLAVVAGVVGAIWTAIETSVFGWNDATVQLILTAVLGALGAHAFFYRPAGINVKLGGGSDAGPPSADPQGRRQL